MPPNGYKTNRRNTAVHDKQYQDDEPDTEQKTEEIEFVESRFYREQWQEEGR